MTGRVQGKVALITGGARGQGRSHALKLAAEGADIVAFDLCHDLKSVAYDLATPDDLKQTVAEVEALDRRALGIQGDVRDLNALTVGVRTARDYGTAAPLAKICAAELSPGSELHTDHEVRDFIRSSVVSGYHPVGTCAMGGDVAKSASGYDSVTDTQLRVRGINGLRVVDASVMPTLPRGNTNAPVIAIAERAADIIAGRAPLVPLDPESAQAPAAV